MLALGARCRSILGLQESCDLTGGISPRPTRMSVPTILLTIRYKKAFAVISKIRELSFLYPSGAQQTTRPAKRGARAITLGWLAKGSEVVASHKRLARLCHCLHARGSGTWCALRAHKGERIG